MSNTTDRIDNAVHTDGSGLPNEISTLVSSIDLQGANGVISGTVVANGSNQPEVNGLVIGANGNNTTKGFNNFNQSFTNQAYTSALPDGDSWLYCDNTGTLGVSQSLPQFDGKDATNYPNSDYYDLSTNEWKNSSDVVYANGRSYLAKIVGVSSGVPTSVEQLAYTPLGITDSFKLDSNKALVTNQGSVPKNSATAWVNFDGTTTPPTIRGSFNVNSVSRVSTGRYEIFFEESMDNTFYSIGSTGSTLSGETGIRYIGEMTEFRTTEKFRVGNMYATSPYNGSTISIIVFGGKN